jgi:hypothetical protein
MKKSWKDFRSQAVAIAVACLWAVPALADPASGAAAFTTDGRTYLGQYAVADQSVSVDIDGLLYQGHYVARADDDAGLRVDTSRTGRWGRAFLFASSAQVLQCRLDAGFPQVSGKCEDAGGRQFELTPAVRR